MFTSSLSHLNKEQKKAVVFGKGPLLIVAGAGTGKTAVITSRIVHLIEKKLARPEEILALTFTDKAAQEMEQRVDSQLSQGYSDLWISTFHAFCDRVLKEEGLAIGLPTDFKLVDQTAAWLLLKQNFARLKLSYYKPIGSPTKFLHALISHFQRCKDQRILPQDCLKYSKAVKEDKERLKEIARAFDIYQKLLLEKGLLDFGDLINYTLLLFEKRPKILEKYRGRFKYILVDEFQDTNWVQYELIKLLAAPKNNLTVSADSKQAIYRWRGASFGNILQFKKDFPKAKQVSLVQNYRSKQNILDLAHKFMSRSSSASEMSRSSSASEMSRSSSASKMSRSSSASESQEGEKLKAKNKGLGRIEHLHFKTADQEIQGVVEKIIQVLKENKEAVFSDFAILARSNNEAQAFARGLERAGIPCQFLAMKGLYSKPMIIDIVSYFKLLDNYHESLALSRILGLPFLGISSDDLARIGQYSSRRAKSIFETLQELPLVSVCQKTAAAVDKIVGLIRKHTELSRQKNVSEVLLAFLEDSGYLEYLVKNDKKEELDQITQFYQRIKSFEETHLDCRLRAFMEEFGLELESGEEGKLNFDIEQGPEVVRLMTLHSAKGLEFKYVFLVNLVDKRFPTIERGDPIEIPEKLIKDILEQGDYHLQEERRLFYVGMTRAKQGLFLTSAEDYGGMTRKKLSRFLTELGFGGAIALSGAKNLKLNHARPPKVKKELLPGHFSFTQLAAFSKCPLQYKYAHILKIPIRGRPVFSFGKTMHNVLFEFAIESVMEKVSFQRLVDIYRREWLDDWYESKGQKQEYFELGEKVLKRFFDDFYAEKPRILHIGGRPALEQGFNIKIGDHILVGKIDRIDEIEGGVEIIDYKTGSSKEKLRPEDKKQLLIYQIACEDIFKLNPKRMTYYYLEDGTRVSFLADEEEIKKAKEEIIEEIERIKRSNFKPTPGWQCEWCDFKDICEFARGRNKS